MADSNYFPMFFRFEGVLTVLMQKVTGLISFDSFEQKWSKWTKVIILGKSWAHLFFSRDVILVTRSAYFCFTWSQLSLLSLPFIYDHLHRKVSTWWIELFGLSETDKTQKCWFAQKLLHARTHFFARTWWNTQDPTFTTFAHFDHFVHFPWYCLLLFYVANEKSW